MTADQYRERAAEIRAIGRLAEATATTATTAFADLGAVGEDFGQRLALRLRECAREAAWTASQVDVFADEAEPEVGRLPEERPANLAIVRAEDGAA
jgi:hypothetical protein